MTLLAGLCFRAAPRWRRLGALTGPAPVRLCQGHGAQSAPWKAGKRCETYRDALGKRFVPAEDDAFNAMVAAFKAATGTEMKRIQRRSFEDVQPKGPRSRRNTGSGPRSGLGSAYAARKLFPTKSSGR